MSFFEKAFLRKRSSLEQTKKSIFNSLFFGKKGNQDSNKFFILAETSYLHGNNKEAIKMIEACIENGGNNEWKNFAFKANVLEDLKEYREAIKLYEMAIELSDTDETVYALYHQIGFCYLNLGNNDKAKEFYTYAIELKGKLIFTKGMKDKECMDGGVMLGLPFKRMYNNRGNAYKNMGDYSLAIKDCKKAIKYDEDYPNPYLLLSQIYSLQGNEEESYENLEYAAILGNQYSIETISKLISDGIISEKDIKSFFDKFSRFSSDKSIMLLVQLLNSKRNTSAYANFHLKTYLELIQFSALNLGNENAMKVLKQLQG